MEIEHAHQHAEAAELNDDFSMLGKFGDAGFPWCKGLGSLAPFGRSGTSVVAADLQPSGYLKCCTTAMPISPSTEMIANARPYLETNTMTLSPQSAIRVATIAK